MLSFYLSRKSVAEVSRTSRGKYYLLAVAEESRTNRRRRRVEIKNIENEKTKQKNDVCVAEESLKSRGRSCVVAYRLRIILEERKSTEEQFFFCKIIKYLLAVAQSYRGRVAEDSFGKRR